MLNPKNMIPMHRRNFLKTSVVSVLPALSPLIPSVAAAANTKNPEPLVPAIKFWGDGEMFEPGDYINELQKCQLSHPISKDRYGTGGALESLEKKFTEITGKERAIFMPSGTMANQLAISVLSGNNTKVFVQETSHIYRDEADAAQAVFQKRLMPLAQNETYFSAKQLQEAIESLPREEAFQSGIGAVSIENPVRRTDGRMVPLEEIKKISEYCRSKNIKLHLDGARLFMASGWSGISIKEYASYFDTVYISLYKYLGASSGAVLCGDKTVIDKMPHLIKIHGGSMYGNWTNAAMAMERLEGFENRLQNSIKRANEIFSELNKLASIKITPLLGGTNIYQLTLSGKADGKKLRESLNKTYNIKMAPFNEKNEAQLTVNETLLYQTADYVIHAFKKSI
jgi:threonine aldolase